MELIADNIDLSAYMHDPEVNNLRPAAECEQDVINHFHAPRENRYAPKLPWKKTFNIFEFRRGEVSIWAGINGHGKSLLLNHVLLDLCVQGEKVCLASMEMKPHMTMARMCRQGAASAKPCVEDIQKLHAFTKGRCWLYTKRGNCKPEVMLALIRYAVANFGIDHFVIDNLTKVIPGESGEKTLNAQKDFINTVCSLAQDLDIHIHVVMHIKKQQDDEKMPNQMDIKGSGAITDLVDNIFIVFRNKEKERAVREGNTIKAPDPDAMVELCKQRNAENEVDTALFKFWFDAFSQQYLPDRHDRPQSYIPKLKPFLELVK